MYGPLCADSQMDYYNTNTDHEMHIYEQKHRHMDTCTQHNTQIQ